MLTYILAKHLKRCDAKLKGLSFYMVASCTLYALLEIAVHFFYLEDLDDRWIFDYQ